MFDSRIPVKTQISLENLAIWTETESCSSFICTQCFDIIVCESGRADILPFINHSHSHKVLSWWPESIRASLFAETHTHTHTRSTALYLGLPGWAGTRMVKSIWILLKQETVSGSGISWAICKCAPRSRQITMPAPHHSVFTGRMPFLPPNQQLQSTDCRKWLLNLFCVSIICDFYYFIFIYFFI